MLRCNSDRPFCLFFFFFSFRRDNLVANASSHYGKRGSPHESMCAKRDRTIHWIYGRYDPRISYVCNNPITGLYVTTGASRRALLVVSLVPFLRRSRYFITHCVSARRCVSRGIVCQITSGSPKDTYPPLIFVYSRITCVSFEFSSFVFIIFFVVVFFFFENYSTGVSICAVSLTIHRFRTLMAQRVRRASHFQFDYSVAPLIIRTNAFAGCDMSV